MRSPFRRKGRKSYWDGFHGDVTLVPSLLLSRTMLCRWASLAANKSGGVIDMSTMTATSARSGGMTKDERFVILASSLGTVFEWYDFYLYGSLASIIGAQFFS